MRRWKKYLAAIAAAALLSSVLAAILWRGRGQTPVRVSRVRREDLISVVRATGEIIPTSYANVLGQGFGRITEIFVHEGQFVRPNDLLLQVDPVQAAAAVRAQQAVVDSARAALRAAKAALQGARERVAQQEAALQKASFDWQQEQKLYQQGVISRRVAESYRMAFADSQASLAAARAGIAVALDQQASAAGTLDQAQAMLLHDEDILSKTTYRAPIAGTVTNIAAHVGENVIPGVPDAPGAYLMTISEMSAAMARVEVGENDVIYLHLGQPARIRIDAYPGQIFTGRVQQVGVQAIESATGMATSQTAGGNSAQEATNYNVDIAIENAPKNLLPGMTVTSLIQTTHKRNAVVVPFQALVLRPKDEAGRSLLPKFRPTPEVQIAAAPEPQSRPMAGGERGVFVVRAGRAIFTPVRIGVIGERDVEALSGVVPGEEIVVGDFAALQDLHSGMRVRIVEHVP